MLQAHVDGSWVGGRAGGRHAVGHAQLGAADGDVLELAAVGSPVEDQGDVFLARQDEAHRPAALEVSQVLRSNLGRHGNFQFKQIGNASVRERVCTYVWNS